MAKTILITGATDGIGLATAQRLAGLGHSLLLHGRSEAKLADVRALIERIGGGAAPETYRADLSRMSEVDALADAILERPGRLDVLINNAGVLKVPDTRAEAGLDLRFMVNAIAPYRLTRRLLQALAPDGSVVNLSSAAQSSVDLEALVGERRLSDSAAYAQSKLALTMWTFDLARELGSGGPAVIAVNPGSLLASKMVKDAYGVAGSDLGVGADILVRAALDPEFSTATGRYFDNDKGRFAAPHANALDAGMNRRLVQAIEALLPEGRGAPAGR